MTREEILGIKKIFKEGMGVYLYEMQGEPNMFDLKGEVLYVDDIGQVHVRWENGSSLALNVNCDSYKLLER
jgi:hypothetical protein